MAYQSFSSHRHAACGTKRTHSSLYSRKLILCIDDEASGLAIRRLLLEEAGYEVLTCLDGKAGLTLFSEMPVQLVVLDYSMPGLNGAQVAEAMRRTKPDVPIVILSGNPEPPCAIENVADAYIVKGGNPPDLLDNLQQLLTRHREPERQGSGYTTTSLAKPRSGKRTPSPSQLQDRVRSRAYELYEQHGSRNGHELDDWLEAEREVVHEQRRIAA